MSTAGGRPMWRRRGREPITDFVIDDDDRRVSRSALAVAAERRAWVVAGVRSGRVCCGRMRGFRRCRWRARSSMSCTSARSRSRARSMRPSRSWIALNELGITHVELMPVAAFAGEHGWGYDGVALFAVHEPYGGPDALKRFVNAAHREGAGGAARRGLQPLWAGGELHGKVRAVCDRCAPDAVGRRGES